MKYAVFNRLTHNLCGDFETPGEAGKWVETYTHEQNQGVDPNSQAYCSPFHFELHELVPSLTPAYNGCEN